MRTYVRTNGAGLVLGGEAAVCYSNDRQLQHSSTEVFADQLGSLGKRGFRRRPVRGSSHASGNQRQESRLRASDHHVLAETPWKISTMRRAGSRQRASARPTNSRHERAELSRNTTYGRTCEVTKHMGRHSQKKQLRTHSLVAKEHQQVGHCDSASVSLASAFLSKKTTEPT